MGRDYANRPGFGGEQRMGDARAIDDRTGFKVFKSDLKMGVGQPARR